MRPKRRYVLVALPDGAKMLAPVLDAHNRLGVRTPAKIAWTSRDGGRVMVLCGHDTLPALLGALPPEATVLRTSGMISRLKRLVAEGKG